MNHLAAQARYYCNLGHWVGFVIASVLTPWLATPLIKRIVSDIKKHREALSKNVENIQNLSKNISQLIGEINSLPQEGSNANTVLFSSTIDQQINNTQRLLDEQLIIYYELNTRISNQRQLNTLFCFFG